MQKRKISVLFAGASYPLETFLGQLVVQLSAKKVDITLTSSQKPDPLFFKLSGFTWLKTPHWNTSSLIFWTHLIVNTLITFGKYPHKTVKALGALKGLPSLKEKFKQWNRVLPYLRGHWDIIYFPWNSASIELDYLMNLPSKTIVSCRGSQINVAPYNPHRKPFLTGLKIALQKVDHIHCVSQAIQTEAQLFGLQREKSTVITPAVDIQLFNLGKPKPPSKTFTVISVGLINWVKGYEYSLHAIKILKDKNVPILYKIIGTGPELDRVLFTLNDLNIKDNVQLLGKLPQSEIISHLQTADAFLLPSLIEGISNAVLEAMACGLTVISSDCGGMPEVINSENGILVPIRDANKIAEAVETLWKNPELKNALGKMARVTVETKFNLQKQVNETLAMYYHVLKI